MFGIALQMRVGDFRYLLKHPKAVLTGMASQWIIMPVFTVYLLNLWPQEPSVAIGLLLVSACPGGNLSNYVTQLSHGNTALSITLSSIVTITCPFVTPLAFFGYAWFVPYTHPVFRTISLNPVDIIPIMLLIMVFPLVAGLIIREKFPSFANKITRVISVSSLVIFISFIAVALVANRNTLFNYIHFVIAIVAVHNIGGMLLGYWWTRWNKLPETDARAICMETGIQNSGLGLVLIFNFFPQLGGMLLVVATWAVWDLVTAGAMAWYWSKRKPANENGTITTVHLQDESFRT